MVHANAVLTPRGRLMLARRVVEEGWPIVRPLSTSMCHGVPRSGGHRAMRRWVRPG